MKKTKLLKQVVRLKRKRHFILTLGVTAVLLGVYQNCGSKQAVTSTTSASTTGSGEPALSSSIYSYTFPSAIGSADQTFTISNGAAVQALYLNVTPTFSSGAFAITGNTCNGTSLSTNSQCTVTVSFKNCTTAVQSGVVQISYSDTSGAAQYPMAFYVYGPAGSVSACSATVFPPTTASTPTPPSE